MGVLMSAVSIGRERPARRSSARFAQNADGAVAIEFALVGPPFLFLICAIVEAGLLYFSQQALNNAVDRAAREMLTGVFQSNASTSDPAARFAAVVCDQHVIFDCSKLKVEVTTSNSFGSASPTQPYDASKKSMTKDFGSRFQCPVGNQIVTIRAAVPVARIFSFLDFSGRALATGGQLMTATRILQAEPYSAKGC